MPHYGYYGGYGDFLANNIYCILLIPVLLLSLSAGRNFYFHHILCGKYHAALVQGVGADWCQHKQTCHGLHNGAARRQVVARGTGGCRDNHAVRLIFV